MRRSWSAVSLGGGIVLSILRAERFGQDASIQRLGGRELEHASQRRRDVHCAHPPPVHAAPDPRTPQDERHVRVQVRRLTVHRDHHVRVAPDGVRLERHDELHTDIRRQLVYPATRHGIGRVPVCEIGGGGPPPPPRPRPPPRGPPPAPPVPRSPPPPHPSP